MMVRGMTARYLLREAYEVKPGDTILIHAAAGGVGLIMCQWAKHLGATVIGTVSSDEKAAVARAHGCDHAIVYTREDFAARVREITGGEGVPVVYDSVGKATFEGSLQVPAPARRDGVVRRGLGRSRPDAAAPPGRARLDLPHPSERLELPSPAPSCWSRERPVRDGGSGKIRIEISKTYALRDAPRAHADIEARKTTGSIVLVVYAARRQGISGVARFTRATQIASGAPPRSSARSTLISTPKPFLSGSLFFSGSISRFQISS